MVNFCLKGNIFFLNVQNGTTIEIVLTFMHHKSQFYFDKLDLIFIEKDLRSHVSYWSWNLSLSSLNVDWFTNTKSTRSYQ